MRSRVTIAAKGGAAAARGLAIVAVFVIFATLYWGGAGENDSFRYIDAALLCAKNGPQLGESHWSLRAPLVAPMAASFALFGPSEFAAALPNFLFAAGLVAMTWTFGAPRMGVRAAFWSSLAVACSAFLVGMQIEIAIAGVELFFLALCFWLFAKAHETGNDLGLRLYAASGLAAGAAWLCRETAGFAVIALVVALAIEKPGRIAPFACVAGAFAAVVVAEIAYYWAASGDPLYRYAIDLGHRGEGGIYSDYEGEKPGAIAWLLRPIGRLMSDPAATPVFALAAAALAIRRVRNALFTANARTAARIFAIASVLSFFTAAYALNVKWPSYYPVAAYAAALVIGAALAALERRYGFGAAACAFALIALVNWAADDFRHYDGIEEARILADLAGTMSSPISTDHLTAIRTRILLRLAGRDESKIVSALESPETPCGNVYVANPSREELRISPRPEWRLTWSGDIRDRRVTHALLDWAGLGVLSPRLSEIIAEPSPVSLYAAAPCR